MCGHVVAHLGIDRKLRHKHSLAHRAVQQGPVHFKVRLNRIDAPEEALVGIAPDDHAAFVDQALNDVPPEMVHAVRHGLIHQIAQQFPLHEVDFQQLVGIAGHGRVDFDVRDPLILPDAQVCVVVPPDAQILALAAGVEHRDVRAGLDVLGDHFGEVRVEQDVTVGQKHVFLARAAQIARVGAQGVEHARVDAHIVPREEGRQDEQSVVFEVQIPFLSGAEVIHQGMIIFLGNHPDVADAGMHHAGHQEVDHPEAAGDRQRRDGARERKFPQAGVVFPGIDQAHHVLHVKTLPCRRLRPVGRPPGPPRPPAIGRLGRPPRCGPVPRPPGNPAQ